MTGTDNTNNKRVYGKKDVQAVLRGAHNIRTHNDKHITKKMNKNNMTNMK